ncbi:hypothetical protein [Leptospira borgpetersenii]|uniref:hypothetical protein n=1 Tax=Leptospira borgpetersenii TaxID=174 RepID=UPI00035DB8B7|nr:hypothetical protein [Leptospira borgpetersenii]MBE8349397.1 hypothetical protein [Leptospira borgpetersenii serovar Hardjo-bovis]MBE8359876.1 hypothetical protein [Leptospira borgpetersenii serovar Hardjo-bovis]MBE8364442.1 hypothetical protein [Leptospira borgpetersenii serovar Balcanica]MBE8367772.1 hypothetical protein [Leptospira borgpetersenii serovar Balcanica]MBE8369520.1 hypothetical protein [Leptospira borgpetersenii serovar Hardjo-bovis]
MIGTDFFQVLGQTLRQMAPSEYEKRGFKSKKNINYKTRKPTEGTGMKRKNAGMNVFA